MIAKGNLHGDGAKLVDYLLRADEGERVEFGGARGFDDYSPDLLQAAARMQQFAETTTRAEMPWFHTQTRIAPGEQLSSAQWEQTLDREEKRLGFTGHARVWSFHVDEATGEKHLHAAWFRLDPETGHVHDPGLYKLRLNEVARRCEIDFGLRQLANEQQPDRAPAADRNETEESRRLGTDVHKIRITILDCLERSDNGRAFKTALEERGMMLANGDRRDCFVVIDHEGGQHALNKKLTGHTVAQTRARFADLDRSQLPGVEQAQAMQRERHAEREPQAATIKEPANQNIHKPMRLKALRRDPWQAVDLALSKGADRTLLAAVATCAEHCAKIAAAYGRASVIVEPQHAEFYRERYDSAAARGDAARRMLAQLAPDQTAQVSPFLHPAVLEQNAELKLQSDTAARNLARDPMRHALPISAELIAENPWNVIWHRLPEEAGRDLAEQVWRTAGRLYHEAIGHGEAAYTAKERQLWDHYAGLIKNVPFGEAGARLSDLDRQELKTTWQAAEHETGQREPPPEIERQFKAAAARVTEPAAPVFDRDAASRAADDKIIDAAIAQPQAMPAAFAAKTTADRPEGRQQPEPLAGSNAPPEAPAAASAHVTAPTAAWQPDPAHELAATADAAVDRATLAGEGLLRGLGKIFESIIGFLADAFSPPPPPTKDQAERMVWAAEEKQEARAEQQTRAEREAQHWLIIEAQQRAAREREAAAENDQHARRREQDRGYERER